MPLSILVEYIFIMKKKKGFIDKGLYGLKDKLKNTNENIVEQQDSTNESNQKADITIKDNDNITSQTQQNAINITEHTLPEEPITEPKKATLDKEFKKALQNRKEEYIRTKKHVIQKTATTLNRLPIKILELERELKELVVAERKIKDTISEINTINEKKWKNDDFSRELSEATKIVENARLQHLMLNSQLSQLEEKSSIKKQSTTNENSIIPELISLKHSQLLKLGLGFTLPLIIGFIISCCIISLTIFFVMGGF
jgi:hypothetical protein